MTKTSNSRLWLTCSAVLSVMVLFSACSSDDTTTDSGEETGLDTDLITDTDTDLETDNPDNLTTTSVVFSCDEIATKFVTRGSANPELDDPSVSASCEDDTLTVRANGIPDFPYIATSPGVPEANDTEYVFPATPAPADQVTEIPVVGAIGVAINGVPIYGPTEGPGGDVNSRPGGFTECGGHNGPTGYHYHLFDVTGSDYCLFTEADVTSEPVLFGYALDGYPIFSGNTRYVSSWYLSDAALYATDTWSAHTYAAGSGDLDQCNGRTDDNGHYAYYTTDDFPYVMGCFRGEVSLTTPAGGPRPGQ